MQTTVKTESPHQHDLEHVENHMSNENCSSKAKVSTELCGSFNIEQLGE